MSYLKMSIGKAVIGALFLVSYVTGMTGMVCDYAERAANGLADVAHAGRFDLAIRSNSLEWYRDGMQLSAFTHNDYKWDKKLIIRWDIVKNSTHAETRAIAEEVFAEAFKKWDDKIGRTFKKASPGQKADIGIRFKPGLRGHEYSVTLNRSILMTLDHFGVDIVINDDRNWTDEDRDDYRNLRFAALHEIGHVLGLGHSESADSVMFRTHEGFETKGDPTLHSDDIEGAQLLYGTPEDLDGRLPHSE